MISVLKAIAQTVLGEQSLPQHVCLFYPKEGYKVGSVELDLILDEDHSKSAQVTENPLQDGRAISDGIFLELQEGSLTGLVTNHSVKIAEERAKQLELQDSETLMAEAKNYQLENRARQAWVDLKTGLGRPESRHGRQAARDNRHVVGSLRQCGYHEYFDRTQRRFRRRPRNKGFVPSNSHRLADGT